ncbi:MAG: YqhA family protein [Zetaproteobacteria bacterium]|nr:MAG: YqhA family protein [Zetaproteobacteria bacterium]
MERVFESFLWNSRFVVLLAVLASMLGMLILFFLAAESMWHLAVEFFQVVTGHEAISTEFHADAVGTIISAIDDFLLATVLLIFSLGLYELFISKIDVAQGDKAASQILMIKNLDDLKDRLVKVVLMILVVAFFKNVLHVTFDEPMNALFMGGGILLVSLATYFSHKAH